MIFKRQNIQFAFLWRNLNFRIDWKINQLIDSLQSLYPDNNTLRLPVPDDAPWEIPRITFSVPNLFKLNIAKDRVDIYFLDSETSIWDILDILREIKEFITNLWGFKEGYYWVIFRSYLQWLEQVSNRVLKKLFHWSIIDKNEWSEVDINIRKITRKDVNISNINYRINENYVIRTDASIGLESGTKSQVLYFEYDINDLDGDIHENWNEKAFLEYVQKLNNDFQDEIINKLQ